MKKEGYDVIVVGLGSSGITSYLSAASNGATVFGMDSAARSVVMVLWQQVRWL